MIDVIEPMKAVQYDGTNGSAIVALVWNASLISDTGTFLSFDNNSGYEMNLDDWIVLKERVGTGLSPDYYVHAIISNTDFGTRFKSSF